ncbi:MAG: hypothetical protein GC165_15320 [Armatimonadetes bacterium]|nr:hypothetical protein [Armatimonadota bacterium]MBS1725557.1 hypothetical protein [Armatimonadota bacterium]
MAGVLLVRRRCPGQTAGGILYQIEGLSGTFFVLVTVDKKLLVSVWNLVEVSASSIINRLNASIRISVFLNDIRVHWLWTGTAPA